MRCLHSHLHANSTFLIGLDLTLHQDVGSTRDVPMRARCARPSPELALRERGKARRHADELGIRRRPRVWKVTRQAADARAAARNRVTSARLYNSASDAQDSTSRRPDARSLRNESDASRPTPELARERERAKTHQHADRLDSQAPATRRGDKTGRGSPESGDERSAASDAQDSTSARCAWIGGYEKSGIDAGADTNVYVGREERRIGKVVGRKKNRIYVVMSDVRASSRTEC